MSAPCSRPRKPLPCTSGHSAGAFFWACADGGVNLGRAGWLSDSRRPESPCRNPGQTRRGLLYDRAPCYHYTRIQSRADALANRAKPGHGGFPKGRCGQKAKTWASSMRQPSSDQPKEGFVMSQDTKLAEAVENLLLHFERMAGPRRPRCPGGWACRAPVPGPTAARRPGRGRSAPAGSR